MAVNNFIILGAGVTGLTLGFELSKKGHSVTILESSSDVGGLAKTHIVDDIPIDSGPHLFHSAHSDIIQYWRDIVGDALVEKSFFAGNYQAGKIYDYPINRETLHEQYDKDEIEKIYTQLEVRDPSDLAAATNYYEYVVALAGPHLANKFFSRYPEKLWGLKANSLSARFAPRRIEIRSERLPFHTGPGRFAGIMEGGCGLLSEKLAEKIEKLGNKIHLNCHVSHLECDQNIGKIQSVRASKGIEFDASQSTVISTLPITKNAAFFGIETKLYFRSILTINLIYKGKERFPKNYDWLYFDDPNVPFHRIGLQTRFSRKNIPDNHHILCCEIAHDGNMTEGESSKIEKNTVQALEELGFLDASELTATFSKNLGPVYPGYYLGHERDVASVSSQLLSIQNFYTLGSLADYAYSDLQVLTAKAIDLAGELANSADITKNGLVKTATRLKASKEIEFGSSKISRLSSEPVFLIAEIGLSHNGDVNLAKELIDKAAEAGFSAAKFQTYSSGRVSKKTRTAKYFEESVDQEESLADFLDKIILSRDDLIELKAYAESKGIIFFSTPFDITSLNLLNDIGCDGFKISSMDIVNLPLIRAAAQTGKPVILSTGMATMGEVETAIDIMIEAENPNVVVLHCVSAYPCDIRLANLARIKKIGDTFDVIPGYSDHTVEVETPALAAVLGARVIEKHITLNKGSDGPDQHFSLEPEEMARMVNLVRKSEAAIEANKSDIAGFELTARQNLRRSIYAAVDLGPGDLITPDSIVIKSPGDGLPAKYYDVIIGRRLISEVKEDHPLAWDNLLN